MSLLGFDFKLGKARPDILYKAGGSHSYHVSMIERDVCGVQSSSSVLWAGHQRQILVCLRSLLSRSWLSAPLGQISGCNRSGIYFTLNSGMIKSRVCACVRACVCVCVCVCVGKSRHIKSTAWRAMEKERHAKDLRSKQEEWQERK